MELSYLIYFPHLARLHFSLPIAITMMVLHCLVGLIAAKIAHSKGANLGKWLIWGLIGGTVALITALRISPHRPEP